jgi:hypothetical protein
MLTALKVAAREGVSAAIAVHAGHGLTAGNVAPVAAIDEKARANSRFFQSRNGMLHSCRFAEHIETAFGSNLFTLFGHERDLLWSRAKRNVYHFVGTRCFEIEVGCNGGGECFDVRVLYVTSIFSQMRGDSICASELAHRSSFDRRWLGTTPGLSERRDMIDVYVESKMSCWHLYWPLGSHQLSWSTA